ncbi:MAG: M28 family peptidase [Planctomycetota bacterium]
MFQDVVDLIGREISAGLAFEELTAVHSIDRWFTFPAFAESARYLASRLKDTGLSRVKVEKYHADGRTRVGSWIMPYAWDVDDAVLTIEEPRELAGTVIARYRETPSSLAMWSGPTPSAGTVADLVLIEEADKPGSYAGRRVKNKIVFTSTRLVFVKGLAVSKGAVGVLSDFVPHRCDLVDHNFWMNAFSDDPGGWGLHAGDSRIFGFNISPRKGMWLRDLLKKHRRVRVSARVDTRLYDGTLPSVTGVIPGSKRNEEVLILGHGFEQGANDNASGVAVMLEAARALARLIHDGVLPEPRRTIRFLVVSECYTTFAYAEEHADRMKRTLGALCVDSVAQKQGPSATALGIHRPPDSNASFLSAYASRLAEKIFTPWRPEYNWRLLPYITTDNVVADPMIGPPTILLSAYPSDKFWHTTADTPDKVDIEALGRIAHFAASYLYSLANAGAVHALYFAALATARAKAALSETTAFTLERSTSGHPNFPGARDQILYRAETGIREVHSVRTMLSLKEARSIAGELAEMSGEIEADGDRDIAQLGEVLPSCGLTLTGVKRSERNKRYLERAAKVIPRRKHIGTMAYDALAAAARKGRADPRWTAGVTAALFWCDGRRTLAKVLELAGAELRTDLAHLVPEFEFMAGKGLIALRKKRR